MSVNCPVDSIGGDPPVWLYRVLKHCFLQRGICSTPTLNADRFQPSDMYQAKGSQKRISLLSKIGSNYAILVAVFIVGTVYVYDLLWHGV